MDDIIEWWAALDSALKPPLISGLVSILTTTIGVVVIFKQIGRQSKNAIAQNTKNEATKLKLAKYEEFLTVVDDAFDAEVTAESAIRRFAFDVQVALHMANVGHGYATPEARPTSFSNIYFNAIDKAIGVVGWIEKWNVIDPRMTVFQTAINVAIRDIQNAHHAYSEVAYALMPSDLPVGPAHQPMPWPLPSEPSLTELKERTTRIERTLMMLGNWLSDFRVEMQNNLVGELFHTKVKHRIPIDHRAFVVTLERHAELQKYFEKQTIWGKDKQKAEVHARETMAAQLKAE